MIRTSRAHSRVFPDEITWSGRKFESTSVWTMVWRWSDQISIWSENPDHRRIQAQLCLIITSSSALGSDQERLRAQLGLIVTSWSALGSAQKRLRAHLGMIITSSSALGSDQKRLRAHDSLIMSTSNA